MRLYRLWNRPQPARLLVAQCLGTTTGSGAAEAVGSSRATINSAVLKGAAAGSNPAASLGFSAFKGGLAALLALLLCAGYGSLALAQGDERGGMAYEDSGYIEEVIAIGSRREARSAADTPAPVDVVGGNDFSDQAGSDLSDLLRTVVPSYNVNTQPISDGGTVVRPANLRGLSPDQTLVLLNGKRRHRAAVLTFLGGGLADGAHGPDIGVFPAIGLKQVEVLRDGAASQYGSDAIAGVINFVLKDDREGAAFEAKYGSTYAGDGDNYQLAGNVGLPVGEYGFVNISAEYGEADATIRSVQRADAAALIAAGYTEVTDLSVNGITTDVTQIWGQPEVRDSIKLFVNAGYDFNALLSAYAFGNYAERTVEGGFFFRHPTGRDNRRIYDGVQVNPATGNAAAVGVDGRVRDSVTGVVIPASAPSVRVGDLSGNSRGDCPAGIPLTGAGGLLPDPAMLSAVSADPNCFTFLELFPGGFVPRFGGLSTDWSAVVGLRGELDFGNGFGYDLSYAYGYNQIDYFIKNTVNPSLGPDTPTEFAPGIYEQIDHNFNLDLAYEVPVDAFASPLYLAAGFEYRREQFDVTAGDLASRALGPLSAPSPAFPRGQGFASSSNGFGGFTRSSSNAEDNIALYTEWEAELIAGFTLQAALRWEDYSSFGSTLNYKLSGLWWVSDGLSIRSAYSTGFRAPTAGQANVTNVSTAFAGDIITEQATLPLSSAAGQFVNSELGGRFTLDAEEARNFSIGAAFAFGGLELTVDYFNIKVDDRIAVSEQQDFRGLLVGAGQRSGLSLADLDILQDANGDGALDAADGETSKILNALNAAGILDSADFAGAEDLASVAFFTNDFDTKTQGVDLVASLPLPAFFGDSDLSFAVNYTDTKVTRLGGLGPTRLRQLEENLPKWKGNANLRHYLGNWRFLGRLNFHGGYSEAHANDGGRWIEAGGELTLDLEVGYTLGGNWEVVVGAANLFDNFPERNPYADVVGSKYPTTAPFGMSGGQYYLKMRYGI